ncbi:hypothetical protein R5R35_014753 [Gryllus longicercus]|uniref:CDK5 regulatory subunit-associated protein 3 n=1 Tax=Gryllus longicercus TaxID=2509291 RepID=A0AAN9YWJ1_9ORTH
MEQDIPIDIHTNKLLDWLVSRRHVNRDWQTHVLTIRAKINNAIQDMPVHEGIAKLLSGSYINYFHCKNIIEILRETEASSRNIFGSYGSQRMKDWQEIVKLYEKDSVYLAEVAQMLMRNVNFEVPSLKKQIAKCEQLQTECDKQVLDYQKRYNSMQNELKVLFKQLGIEGKKVKHELVARLQELPDIYNKVAENAKLLSKAVEYYSAFVVLITGQEHPGGCVSMLKYLIEHGNTTTYEWTYGEAPIKIEEPPLIVNLEDEIENIENDTIDFGEDEGGIDFGDDNGNEIDFGENVVDESGDIDWGNSTEVETAEVSTAEAQEIDFDISLEESGIVVESAGMEGGVAKDFNAYTILDNPKTRNMIIDDLMELQAFLKMRLFDMKGANDLISMSQMQSADTILQVQTPESILAMLDVVQVTLANLTSTSAQYLHNIKHSERFVEHMAHNVKQKESVMQRCKDSQDAARKRKVELQEEAKALQPRVQLIIKKTKELQKEIEQDISKRYKNRPVNIMGGVNMM